MSSNDTRRKLEDAIEEYSAIVGLPDRVVDAIAAHEEAIYKEGYEQGASEEAQSQEYKERDHNNV